ncbi:MAG: cobalt transporter [Nitrospirae bacterium]|nr:cobalt transporter [Nitrospirota bacterium]
MSVFLFFSLQYSAFSSEKDKWKGVDESVIEKIAKEHGREAREPLVNKDQGDLLLFAFLTAGAVGGFGAGYYWRMLTERKNTDIIKCKRTEDPTNGDASAL